MKRLTNILIGVSLLALAAVVGFSSPDTVDAANQHVGGNVGGQTTFLGYKEMLYYYWF